MSVQPTPEPECRDCGAADIEMFIDGRARDLGGLVVRRVLPSSKRRMVGPFIFFDEMGPVDIPAGEGIDVRPHPHINLATVTYLFEGEIQHRDSLGSDQLIQPGAVNWMTAGKGIVHSERTADAERARDKRLHGIQLWVALPDAHEETEPEFYHHPAASMPEVQQGDATIRVLAGSAYGVTSPVRIYSELFYAEAVLPYGGRLSIPDAEERAAYVVQGKITCQNETAEPGRMMVFAKSARPEIVASEDARVMLLGGAAVGKRHIWWNFVSSRPERIEAAKEDWRQKRFPDVPGDNVEFIPLPDKS